MAHLDPPGKTFLTHSPCGLRIEFLAAAPPSPHQGNGVLELWVSPQHASNPSCELRNFSNRDDHTRVFDRISLPGLGEDSFQSCFYDPFHLALHFTHGQVLHLVPSAEFPGLSLWFDQPQTIDFKSDKADCRRTPEGWPPERHFGVTHPDRGLLFHFDAWLGAGPGSFVHPSVFGANRSRYARARLAAGQPIQITALLADEPACLAPPAPDAILERNTRAISGLAPPVTLSLRGHEQLGELLAGNQLVLLAMQDRMGAIRAALNRIYYMIWVRDGAIIEVFHAHSGWYTCLQRWASFLLRNPTPIKEPGYPPGRAFTMLVNPVTKWEEDGAFYAVWSAFCCATQSPFFDREAGDQALSRAISVPEAASVLREALDWLERYCFDQETGLFGRYFACETPFAGSRDYGFDHAVGLAVDATPTLWEGKEVRRSMDLYINQLGLAAWRMMAYLDPDQADSWTEKADRLEACMAGWFPAEGLPDYGSLVLADGSTRPAGPFGLDRTDYQWALSVSPFFCQEPKAPGIREQLFRKTLEAPDRCFLAAFFSITQALDPIDTPESEIVQALLMAAEPCHRPGRFLAMPGTVVEMLGVEDGDRWHDIRPQAFSIGPLLATATGLGLRRLPFGLAVRPTAFLESIHGFVWQRTVLDLRFCGSGAGARIRVNGCRIEGTWQLPSECLEEPRTEVVVEAVPTPAPLPLWQSSSVHLRSVHPCAGGTDADGPGNGYLYSLQAYGGNFIRFLAPEGTCFTMHDSSGCGLDLQVSFAAGSAWVRFPGHGAFTLKAWVAR